MENVDELRAVKYDGINLVWQLRGTNQIFIEDKLIMYIELHIECHICTCMILFIDI